MSEGRKRKRSQQAREDEKEAKTNKKIMRKREIKKSAGYIFGRATRTSFLSIASVGKAQGIINKKGKKKGKRDCAYVKSFFESRVQGTT